LPGRSSQRDANVGIGPLARNHAFVDGNKRTAIVTAMLFLALNGYRMTADDGQVYVFTMALAAGEIDETGASAFFRDHALPA
jgi:death-on-curing protein